MKLQALFPIVFVTIFFGQVILVTIVQSYQKADAQMLLVSTNQTQGATAQPTYVYKYANGLFTVLYPTNWEIVPRSSSSLGYPYFGSDTVVYFRPISNTGATPSPIDTPLLGISQEVEQQVLDTNDMQLKPKSLEQIADESMALYRDPSSKVGFKLLKNEATTVGGLPARQTQYLLEGLGTLGMDTFVIKDGKLYTITLQAPYNRVPEVLPVAKYIIQSLQFTG